MPLLLLIALLIVLLPIFFIVLLFHLTTSGLEVVGFSFEFALFSVLAILLGSLINIPLGRMKYVEVEERYFFGLFHRKHMQARGISINVGGALIPIFLASYVLVVAAPIEEALLATALMTFVCYFVSRVDPGKGISLPLIIPPLFAVLFAFLLAPDDRVAVAFVSGVFGVLFGADVLHIPDIQRKASGVLLIGGAGVFDGIFLVAIVAALLAGL